MNKTDEYINLLYETQALSEDMGIDLPNVGKGLVKKISSTIDVKNPIGTMKKIKKLTPKGFDNLNAVKKAEAYASDKFEKFGVFKKTATQVIKNSLSGVSPKVADVAGGFLAVTAMVVKKSDKNKSPEKVLKVNIKEFITRARKFGEDYDEDDETQKGKMRTSDVTDLSVAWVVIVMSTAVAVGLINGSFVISAAISAFVAASAQTIFIVLLVLAFLFGIVVVAAKSLGGGA